MGNTWFSTTATHISLLNMPDVVLTTIFEKCDIVAIQCLRKTCHSIRNFIDDTKPQQNIVTLQIDVDLGDSIRLEIVGNPYTKSQQNNHIVDIGEFYPDGEIVLIDFETKNDNTQIIWYREDGQRVKQIKNESYLNAVSRDLNTILDCKLPILRKFLVNCHDYILLEELNISLKSKPIPLQVNSFVMNGIIHQNQILQILPYICPNSLIVLGFGYLGNTVCFDKIMKLEQWRKAKKLFMDEIVPITAGIQSFAHFEVAKVCFVEVTLEDLIYLKTIFINSLSTSKHFILFTDRCSGEGELDNVFGNPVPNLGLIYAEKVWFFKRPNDKEFVVYFGQNFGYRFKFEFKLIKKENVSKGAIIYD